MTDWITITRCFYLQGVFVPCKIILKKVLTNQKCCGIINFVVEKQVGVDDAEGPPVPIPNTEVKLSGAENTWLATARENREMPTLKVSTQ